MEQLKVKRVDQIKEKEDGVLYISKKYELAIHKCPCGCGIDAVTPLRGPHSWVLTEKGDSATLRPSISNRTCKTHYYITENKIEVCGDSPYKG